MLSMVKTITLNGLEGHLIDVQTDITSGLPSFEIVGLPDTTVKEAKERVKTAIKNLKYQFPSKKILINLAPASLRKGGSKFDLPMAVGILLALGIISPYVQSSLYNTIFIGEMSLSGKINKVTGVLPMCMEAQNLGIKRIILPADNSYEAANIKNIEIIPVKTLKELVEYLNENRKIESVKANLKNIFEEDNIYSLDFSDVKGQKNVKRGLEIAAAGGHNCLLIGSPGSGKTMLARRLPTILPKLTFEEALEITKIYSITGKLKENLIIQRPFRAPHYTISKSSLIGGGRTPKPGEISLAHYGVLFLDELPEFSRSTLEALRGPLEDRNITINRVETTIKYPSNFMMIASMNPCECGYYGSDFKKCMCTTKAIRRYAGKISGPILDRIDLHIEVRPVKYEDLKVQNEEETSITIKERVDRARKIQLERYEGIDIFCNAELDIKLMKKFCKIDKKSQEILEKVFRKYGLSARAYDKILKVARTIADLDEAKNIQYKHIAEAIQYRSLDTRYFGN